jgi:biotin operon repressor
MADSFTRRLFMWLDQICSDHSVSALAFKLAYVIGGFINRTRGDAWPSQETIANRLGITTRAVRNLVDLLTDGGHLEVIDARGRGRTIHYRMILKKGNDASSFSEPQNRNAGSAIRPTEKRNSGSGISLGKAEAPFPHSGNKTGTAVHENRNGHVIKTGTAVPTEPSDELSEEPSDKIYPSKPDLFGGEQALKSSGKKGPSKKAKSKADDEAFEAWWAIYPRKVGKLGAKRKFDNIIATGTVPLTKLMDGAQRYAAEQAGTEQEYIKHPTTWLSHGCWDDAPQAPRSQPQQHQYRQGDAGATAVNTLMRAAREFRK